jgi:serine/threonine protein kinase
MKYVRNNKVVEYIADKYKTSSLADITRIIFLEICEAIKYLHDHGITNRDIKVDNILCSQTTNFGN